jgi:hypothetical protein
MAGEPFNFKKWFFSLIPASGEQWGKWIDFIWKLAVIILVYFFIWLPIKEKFFTVKPQIPTHQQEIGSNTGINKLIVQKLVVI